MNAVLPSLLFLAAPQNVSPPVEVAYEAVQPHVAVDGDGNPVVVFIREGNVQVARSGDRGRTFADPVTAINARGKAVAGHQQGPRVAIDSAGAVYVTAAVPPARTAEIRYPRNDLFLAVSTDGGKTFSKPLRLNDRSQSAGASLHWSGVSPGGEVHVAWLDGRGGKGQTLRYARVPARTRKTPDSVRIAPLASERCAPALSVDRRGIPVVVFREGGPSKNRRILLASPQKSGRSFADPAPVNRIDSGVSASPANAPALAISADGARFAVAWMDQRVPKDPGNVYWTVGPRRRLPEESVTHDVRSRYQGRPAVAFGRDGTAWCVWEDGRDSTQHLYALCSKSRKNVRVTEEDETPVAFPALASGGGGVALAYESDGSVALRLLEAP